MQDNKLKTITNLFEGREIRSMWNSEKEDYYFSVVDVISVLTDSSNPKRYWTDLRSKLDAEEIFRLIESVPSKNAEPFKLWLAKLGRQEVDNIFDPSKGIDKMIEYYLRKGYTLEWIEARIKAIINRKKLTNTWKENGIEKEYEYGILTNEIYKTWSGMKASEYKEYKGIRKESLRDNMTDIEVLLTDLGELTTRDIVQNEKPKGFEENLKSS